VDFPHQDLAVQVAVCLRVQGKSHIFTHMVLC